MILLEKIEISCNDKKRGLIIPRKITKDLAYFCGVLIGDGHLGYYKEKRKYCISCVGHPVDEKEFYDDVLIPLIKKLFGISVNARLYDKGTTYGFRINSKGLITFFSKVLGLPTGNKSGIIRIPNKIKKSDSLVKSFIQGYADTDFCLALKKRYKKIQYYPVIVGVSKSKKMIEDVSKYLKKCNFIVSEDYNRSYFDKRVNKLIITPRFQLYGHKQLVLWMSLIGFRSPKHLKKVNLWMKRNKNHPWPSIRFLAGDGVPRKDILN